MICGRRSTVGRAGAEGRVVRRVFVHIIFF